MPSEERLDIDPLKNAVNALEASVCDYDEVFGFARDFIPYAKEFIEKLEAKL